MSEVKIGFTDLMDVLHARKWTNKKIAEELGVNRRTIHRWISGETPTPKIAILALERIIMYP